MSSFIIFIKVFDLQEKWSMKYRSVQQDTGETYKKQKQYMGQGIQE